MNARNLGILSIAAVVIIIAAVWMSHSRAPDTVASQPNLYPELKGKLDSVTGISVYKAGDQLAVQIARDGGAWKVKQRNDFPADPAKVKSLLLNLEEAQLREQKTANPENYSALSVQDVSDAATTGVRLELTGAPVPVKLIVGKHDSAAHATYVRRAGEKQSWLIGTELDAPSDPMQWLKRDVLNIGADRIQEVATHISGSPSYTSFKKTRADANFDVKPLPKGRELNSVSAPNSIAQSLVSLQLEDVKPASELAGEKNPSHAVFKTFDGLVIESTGYKIGDKNWVTFHAGFDPELAKRFYVATAAPEKKDEKSDSVKKDDAKAAAKTDDKKADNSLEDAIKKGEDEAKSLNASLEPWAFALAGYKYDTIFKPLDDLLKKPEPAKKK